MPGGYLNGVLVDGADRQAAASVVKQLHDKEIEIANVRNELARVQVRGPVDRSMQTSGS
jgi:hypothetical protein